MTMKNWYGLLGGRRNQFHQYIHSIVSDFALMMKPTLVMLDGMNVLMKNGPTGGRLSDVKPMNTIVAGTDMVAVDAYGYTHLLERDIAELTYLHKAARARPGQHQLEGSCSTKKCRRESMKARTVRRIAQVFFFALFLFFVFVTDLRYLKGYPVSLFLELDPLVAFATAITTHTVYMGLLWSLLLILPTLLFGRDFLQLDLSLRHPASLHRLAAGQTPRGGTRAHRGQPLQKTVFAEIRHPHRHDRGGDLRHACKSAGSIPICLFHRSMTQVILPMLNLFFPSSIYVRQYFHVGAWVIGFLLLFLVGMNVVIPRFFCRVLCPLGAFLGTLSTAALWRIDRDPTQMRGLRPLPEKLRRRVRPAHATAQERMFRLLQLHRGLPGGRHLVQVHAAAPARNHRARRAGPPRVSRHVDRPRLLRLWPRVRRAATGITTKKSSARPVRWRKRIFSIAASNATSASAPVRRTCCSRR